MERTVRFEKGIHDLALVFTIQGCAGFSVSNVIFSYSVLTDLNE